MSTVGAQHETKLPSNRNSWLPPPLSFLPSALYQVAEARILEVSVGISPTLVPLSTVQCCQIHLQNVSRAAHFPLALPRPAILSRRCFSAVASHLVLLPHFHAWLFRAILPKRAARGVETSHKSNQVRTYFVSFPKQKRQAIPLVALPDGLCLLIRALTHSTHIH